ncbi:hypothetical protein ABMY26_34370 [Azospirillum sp. HJ39]|uniref:hypothetical protein n=1 Tax=Azospirillum sp. HJ39 TaxID=3159496 RepID=UPI0035586569
MEFILESLAKIPGGVARLSNLASGLRLDHIPPSVLRKLLAETAKAGTGPGGMSCHLVYGRLRDCIVRLEQELSFQRPTPPVCESGCAIVLPLGIFNGEARFQLFKRDYLDRARDLGLLPRTLESPYDLDMLLSYLRQGFQDGMPENGGLGNPALGIVTFLTPLDDTWAELTKHRITTLSPLDSMPAGCDVGKILDELGLPYQDTNGWLIELRTSLPLNEIVNHSGKRGRCAAPTVIESIEHDYFRHWPNRTDDDRYGRTLHFQTLRGGLPDGAGRPEIIVDHIPGSVLASGFEVSILGRIPGRQIPPPSTVATHLVGRQDPYDLIKEICARL